MSTDTDVRRPSDTLVVVVSSLLRPVGPGGLLRLRLSLARELPLATSPAGLGRARIACVVHDDAEGSTMTASDDGATRLVGRTVVDAAGQPLGQLAGTYVETQSGEILFAAVRMLRRGRRKLVIVCLRGAHIEPSTISVTSGRELARRAPSVRPGAELPVAEEERLYAHYDLPLPVVGDDDRRLSPAETS